MTQVVRGAGPGLRVGLCALCVSVAPHFLFPDRSCSAATAAVDTQIDLVAMLATLSPDHRDVIVLRELQRMTYDEIAAALKIPRGTVESRIFRARRELRERFEEYVK